MGAASAEEGGTLSIVSVVLNDRVGVERTLRSYGYVGNAVHQIGGLLDAGRQQVDGRVFYICDYEPLEIGAWSREIADAFGVGPPRKVPTALLRAGAWVGDLSKLVGVAEPPMTSFRLRNMLTSATFDQSAVYAIVGECPYTQTEGVQETVRWMRGPAGLV